MRIVIDLNVFVSAAIAPGTPANLVRRAGAGEAKMIVCPRLFDELYEVAPPPKFARFLTPEEVAAFLLRLCDQAEERSDPVNVVALSRDPDDDYLVALAIEGGQTHS